MKRKMGLMSVLALATVTLVACGGGENKTESSSSERQEASSQVKEAARSIIKGMLKEDVTVDGDNVSFFMIEVAAVDDPTEVAKGINEEGVIINAEVTQVEGEFKAADFKAGQAVEVTLKGEAIMTRSLPPQIPGVSIISIKKL